MVVPGHLLRFDSRYAQIYESLHNGELGRPVSIYLKRSRVKSLFETYQRTHTVYELTVHDIDTAIWYAGSKVKKVKAYGRSVMKADVPDILWACLEFENNVIAVLESNWMTPDRAGIAMADQTEVIAGKGRHTLKLAIQACIYGKTRAAELLLIYTYTILWRDGYTVL